MGDKGIAYYENKIVDLQRQLAEAQRERDEARTERDKVLAYTDSGIAGLHQHLDRVEPKVEALRAERDKLRAGLEPLRPFMDTHNDGAIEWCGECGHPCQVVRPGKTQCAVCEYADVIDRLWVRVWGLEVVVRQYLERMIDVPADVAELFEGENQSAMGALGGGDE